jgi:hypothetical protein
MGSRLAPFLLSVRACGGNQGKAASEPLRARFKVIRVEMYHRAAPGRVLTAAEQLQEKQQPGKLKRIWNIIKE